MGPATDRDDIVTRLASALEPFDRVGFAVLFGSAAAGRLREDSDVDLAVYFVTGPGPERTPRSAARSNSASDPGASFPLEVEADVEFGEETDVQVAAERAVDRNVDLLVLNRAPATVCAAALATGTPVVIRAAGLYTRYFLAVTRTASDFERTRREFREIRERSRSLSDADRSRLEQIVDFVDEELGDREAFTDLSLERYRTDRHLRRDVDRWAEMLINAAIDIAKILLASERREVPRTYAQILDDLRTVDGFASLADRLRGLATLRNVLAHEYLDLRYTRVKRFADRDALAVADLADRTRARLGG